jgi:hypothetical protein
MRVSQHTPANAQNHRSVAFDQCFERVWIVVFYEAIEKSLFRHISKLPGLAAQTTHHGEHLAIDDPSSFQANDSGL